MFELAHRGTLFLDEIAEMMPATQVKLLRVLQERTFRRLGGRQEQSVDVRVIAATNVNPMEAVKHGKLREDLYYRLNVFAIELPPLRDRKEDIPLLAQHFLTEFNERNGKSVRAVDQEAMHLLEQYPWPGNIRELRNVMERATILAEGTSSSRSTCRRRSSRRGEETLPTVTLSPGTTVDEAERRPDPADARAHAQQQDARGRDSRHQPEDPAQQAESDARSDGGTGEGRTQARPQQATTGTTEGSHSFEHQSQTGRRRHHARRGRRGGSERLPPEHAVARSCSRRRRRAPSCCRGRCFSAPRVVVEQPERSLRGAARGRRHPLDPRIQHRLFARTSPTPPSSDPEGVAIATRSRRAEGVPMPEQRDFDRS